MTYAPWKVIGHPSKVQLQVYQNEPNKPTNSKKSLLAMDGICPICHTRCGFIKCGFYSRGLIESLGNKKQERIQRYLCKKDLKKKRTFSCLPEHIIPYRIYSLALIIKIMTIVEEYAHVRGSQLLDKLCASLPELRDSCIDLPHLTDFSSMLHKAMNKCAVAGIQTCGTVKEFIDYSLTYSYGDRTGLLAIQQAFYSSTSGLFLFGTPSQAR